MKKLLKKLAPVLAFIIIYLLAGCGVTGHPQPVPAPNVAPIASVQQ
jgi:hypothetical protein